MSHIELYAELLTNIRTVTLVASLRTESNQETRIELSGDGQTITITHEGFTASLRLPTRMSGGGIAALTIPPNPSKDLTLRLRVEETAPGLLTFEHSDENLVPWPATALEDALSINCVRCGNAIVDVSRIREWRDLPNENWAEMMDFWHCHKPREDEPGSAQDGAVDKKGYSASNRLEALSGSGFVSLVYFILASADCTGIKTDEEQDVPVLCCEACGLQLGTTDPSTSGWKIYKWSVRVISNDDSGARTTTLFPIPKWISTQILASVENSGVRRLVVEPTRRSGDSKDGLLLWLFTDSLAFSSSHNFWARKDPTRAMKILWKHVDDAPAIVDSHQFSHEHLIFPAHVYEALRLSLIDSKLLLPKSARLFQDWNIGLLPRFSWEDVRGSDATVLPPSKSMSNEELEKFDHKEVYDEREVIRGLEHANALLE